MRKKTIELVLLKEDHETASYVMSSDCPITRALRRAGYPHLRDFGMGIRNERGNYLVHENSNEAYRAMRDKVFNMNINNVGKILSVEAETFTASIEIDIPEEEDELMGMKEEPRIEDEQDFI